MAEVMEPEHPGMHTTDTIDFDVVISGEVWLELDDGAESSWDRVTPSSRTATRHAWHNRPPSRAPWPSPSSALGATLTERVADLGCRPQPRDGAGPDRRVAREIG